MKSLSVPFQQVWPTDSIAASKDRARIPGSLCTGIMGGRVSVKIFGEIIAPSTPKNRATMCM